MKLIQVTDSLFINLDHVTVIREYPPGESPDEGDDSVEGSGFRPGTNMAGLVSVPSEKWVVLLFCNSGIVYKLTGNLAEMLRARLDEWRGR